MEKDMMKKIIQKIINKNNLEQEDVKFIIESIQKEDFEPLQFSGMLCALQTKGIDADELYYFVKNLIAKANTIELDSDCIDVCGTGGDNSSTFNISTASVFVIAAAGCKVAKHGNKSVSSKSGSFDVLQSLGININVETKLIKECFKKTNIGFLFAPAHHPVFKNIGETRAKLGIKTIFNMMGPLLNPAKVKKQLIGVFNENITETTAQVMKKIGIQSGMVVNGQGLDEITITGTTKITELKNRVINSYIFDPKKYNMNYCSIEELKASDSKKSAEIIINIFKGEKSPRRDIVVLNSAAALVINGIAQDFKEGIKIADKAIESGKALEKLNQVKNILKF